MTRWFVPLIALALLTPAVGHADSPLLGFSDKIIGADTEERDYFGRGVALDVDTLAAGAEGEGPGFFAPGAVYLFERGGDGCWRQVRKLRPPDSFVYEWGDDLALDRDTLVAGTWNFNDSFHGAAYVFERDFGGPNNWGLRATLTDPEPDPYGFFGNAVDIEGGLTAVGATGEPGPDGSTGALFIFRRWPEPPQWTLEARLLPSRDAGQGFGAAVAVGTDRAVAGAPNGGIAALETGLAYVFERDPVSGEWREVAILAPSNAAAGDSFGKAIAMDGDVIVVGTPGYGSSETPGKVYLFERDEAGGWPETARFAASNSSIYENLGYSVGVAGRFAVAGTDVCSGVTGCGDPGTAYLFRRTGGPSDAWAEVARLGLPDHTETVKLGSAVAISVSTVAAGAWEDGEAGYYAGAVYLYGPVRCAPAPGSR